MSTSARRIIRTSPRPIAPAMPIIAMTPNMAFAIIAAAGGRARAKRRRGSRRARWRAAVIPDVEILAYVVEIGGDAIDRDNFEAAQIDKNPFFCPDEAAAGRWEKLVDEARKAGSSLGAVIECVATGVPPGWGAPLYAKLDSELAAAMMSINAVKGVEIGAGFGAARLARRGKCRPDAASAEGSNHPEFLANNAGGIAGGISTGQPVVVRVAFKPTSSILTPVETITSDRRSHRHRHQRPPRPLRRHPRHAGGRGDDGAGAGGPETAAPGAVRIIRRSFCGVLCPSTRHRLPHCRRSNAAIGFAPGDEQHELFALSGKFAEVADAGVAQARTRVGWGCSDMLAGGDLLGAAFCGNDTLQAAVMALTGSLRARPSARHCGRQIGARWRIRSGVFCHSLHRTPASQSA